ncbi:MAG: primase, partial [Chloroflexi bacterium]|nr:primase [Chloroflexota bacterium]
MADERDQIRERLSIETLVGEHVALKRSGRNLMGLCPFHKEKTPSFVVSPERGSFHCFGCGASGDIFRFYMLIHKVEFPDALQALAARTGVELDPEAARRKASESRAHDVLQAVSLYFQQALAGNAGKPGRDYLAGRGLSQETIERFALGYLPDWGEGMRRDLPPRGVSEQELIDAGVLLPTDQGREPFCALHGRVIFPIRDLQGRVCGFGGRILADGQPKYLNSRQSALFDKSSVLYAIDRAAEAVRSSGEVVIVEGYLDALRAHQAGFSNVVASLGTAITVRQLSLLARLRPRDGVQLRTVLALDADPAGARAAAEAGVRATVALRQPQTSSTPAIGKTAQAPLDLRIATLPAGQDPDEVIAADPRIWLEAIANAKPAMDHLFDLVLNSLDRRLPTFTQDLLSQLLPLIGQLQGVGQQQPYLERLQSITHIETSALRGELARLRGEARRAQRQPTTRQSEIATLRQVAQARNPRELIEDECLSVLLRGMPFDAQTLEALNGLPLKSDAGKRILEAVLAAHEGGVQPSAETVRLRLSDEDLARVEQIMEAPAPPDIEPHKAFAAFKAYRSRLERLAQSERLREQSALLDQVDG